jgi:transposase
MDLAPHRASLRHLTRTDPDPRVRHRADALLVVASGLSLTRAAAQIGCSRNSLHTWAERYLAEGRNGLLDRPRLGRPRKLDAAACELLETALGASPLDHGYPVTVWTVADLHDLLDRHGYRVSLPTVYRTLERLGYRYRRPRHDLTHRQDADAVTSAKHVLAELQKRGLLPDLDSAWSTWMSVTSTPIPTWQRSGPEPGRR